MKKRLFGDIIDILENQSKVMKNKTLKGMLIKTTVDDFFIGSENGLVDLYKLFDTNQTKNIRDIKKYYNDDGFNVSFEGKGFTYIFTITLDEDEKYLCDCSKYEIHSNFKYEFTEEEYQASLAEFLERKISG